MPPRSQEEKERRRQLHKEKQEARKKAKDEAAKKKEVGVVKSAASALKLENVAEKKMEATQEESWSLLKSLPDDAIAQVLCFLPSRDLGCVTLTCNHLNGVLGEVRVTHILSRLHRPHQKILGGVGFVDLCDSQAEARQLLANSFGGGNTRRAITKKSKRGDNGADEYVAYARFLEESVGGYSTLSVGGRKRPTVLPPCVNGRLASVSPEHTLCRIGGDGEKCGAGGSGVASWGVGKRGQLGHGKREDQREPRMLLGGIGYGIRIVQVSAGGGIVRVAHSLLLTSAGRVLSFGTAQYGQLGHGYSSGKQLSDALRPQYIEALSHVRCTSVSAGELHSAVVTTDGDLYTWGDGFCGQLGLGDKRPQLLPKQVVLGDIEDEVIVSVSCGCRHTLAVTDDGQVFSFGLGHFGVLGRSFTPFEYDADTAIMDMGEDMLPPPMAMVPAANEPALNDEAGVYELTDQTRAQLDLLANLSLDDSSDQCYPVLVDSLEGINIVGACAGYRHSMVLDDEGSLYTFGSGACGALGHGDTIKQEYPLKVMDFVHQGIRIMQMSAGVDMSMAVSTKGDVYAWGKATEGRLGLGTLFNEVKLPRHVPIPGKDGMNNAKAVDVECGYVHSIIVGLDGTIHMCGGVGIDGEDDGQKEDMDDLQMGKPAQVPDYNIWHRVPEPKAKVKTERWKKYGKYELKGRSAMLSGRED